MGGRRGKNVQRHTIQRGREGEREGGGEGRGRICVYVCPAVHLDLENLHSKPRGAVAADGDVTALNGTRRPRDSLQWDWQAT